MKKYITILVNSIEEYNELLHNNIDDFILGINQNTSEFYFKTSQNKTHIYGLLNINSLTKYDNFNLEDYEYYYEDLSSNKINNTLPFKFNELEHLNEYNIAPYNAFKIGIYDNNNKIGEIYLDKDFIKKYDQRLYRVGLLSDIHFNDYDLEYLTDDDQSEYKYDLDNALQFMHDKQSIEFTCISGDVSSNNYNHMLAFNSYINDYHKDKPLFICKGNHDYCSMYGKDDLEWHNLTWLNVNNNYEVHWQNENEKINYYFIKEFIGKANTIKQDIYIFLSLNYGAYGDQANSNIKVGEGQNDYQYFREEDIEWLESVLETYKNTRCFVFLHYFFKQKAGNNNGNQDLYTYCCKGRTRRYTLWGKQFDELNTLNNKYVNSIWFSGHSHYKWCSQKYDQTLNICGNEYSFVENDGDQVGSITRLEKLNECGYNVHLPSGARPLKEVNYYDPLLKESEGAIMDVYEDYVDIRGIEFKTSRTNELYNHDNNYINNLKNIINRYHPTSRNQYMNSSNIRFDNGEFESNNVIVRELDDDYIEFEIFDNENIYINDNQYIYPLSNKFVAILKVEDYIILNGDTLEDATNELTSTHNIGFLDLITNPNEYKYYFESYHVYSIFDYGIRLKMSSQLQNNSNIQNKHWIIRLKAKLMFKELNLKQLGYENKYTPIAHYRLYNRKYEEES